MHRAAIATLLLTGQAPLLAGPPESPNIVVKGETDKLDKPVCRTEQVTGSLFPRRVCSTPREDRQRQAQERAALDQTLEILQADHLRTQQATSAQEQMAVGRTR